MPVIMLRIFANLRTAILTTYRTVAVVPRLEQGHDVDGGVSNIYKKEATPQGLQKCCLHLFEKPSCTSRPAVLLHPTVYSMSVDCRHITGPTVF